MNASEGLTRPAPKALTHAAPQALTRTELDALPRRRLGNESRVKPSVWQVDTPRGPYLVKDARTAGPATRWLARWLLGRERRVLERLGTLDGVPHVEARIDRDAIALTWIPGRMLDDALFRARPRELVEQLGSLTERMHERGVYHLDLHQRRNLLVDDEGRLRVVDFGAALAPGAIARALFGPLLRFIDGQAGTKYLARFTPQLLTEAEARAVLRHRRLRALWPFTPHGPVERRAAEQRLRVLRERA